MAPSPKPPRAPSNAPRLTGGGKAENVAATSAAAVAVASTSAVAVVGEDEALESCVGADIATYLEVVDEQLRRINEALEKIDEGLNRSQPAIPGKLRIHMLSKGDGRRAPMLIAWMRSAAKKKWYPKRLPWKHAASRAKFVGGFALNCKQTKQLLVEAEHLASLRTEALAKRRSILLSLKYLGEKMARATEEAIDKAEMLHAECEENIVLKDR